MIFNNFSNYGANPPDPTDIELPFFGYNAEEQNPITDLTYMRYRYYSPDTARFISEDDYLGEDENILSQNRYLYANSDPVNNQDPTGHFTSLIVLQAEANAKRYGTQAFMSYADWNIALQRGAVNESSYEDYTMNWNVANAYITRGADAAYALCASYNCTPGSQVDAAIQQMQNDISNAWRTTNEVINEIRDGNISDWEASPDNPKNWKSGGSHDDSNGNGNEDWHNEAKNVLLYSGKIDNNNNEDSKCGDRTKKQLESMNSISSWDIMNTAGRQIEKMQELFWSTSFFGGGWDIAKELLDHFLAGTGTDYYSSKLSSKAKNHTSFIKYVNQSMHAIFSVSHSASYDIASQKYNAKNRSTNEIILAMQGGMHQAMLPAFDGIVSAINGTGITVHGITGSKIKLKRFLATSSNFIGTITYDFWDNFGLDSTDVEKNIEKGINKYVKGCFRSNFVAWYILQHAEWYKKVFKPYKSNFSFNVDFYGNTRTGEFQYAIIE